MEILCVHGNGENTCRKCWLADESFYKVHEAEIDLMKKIERMTGQVPVGFGDLLKCLAHPDMIELTKKYIKTVEENREFL